MMCISMSSYESLDVKLYPENQTCFPLQLIHQGKSDFPPNTAEVY